MSEPTRILQVFASLNVGGAECRMMDVYRILDKEKIQFDFITMSNDNQFFEKEIRSYDGRIYKIGNPRENGLFSNLRALISIMKMNNYSAVHAHTSYHCGIVSLAAKIAGIKIRISHGRTTGTIQQGLLSNMYITIGRFLIKMFTTDRLCISKDAGEYLFGKKGMLTGNASILPNAINLKEYENINSVDEDLKRNLTDSIVIGHIGRFSKMKNHQFLIDVFKQLSTFDRKYKLLLVGDGTLKEEIEKKVYEHSLNEFVIFTGQRRDVPFLLSEIDVFIMPSIYEGLGGVVIEAQAAGIPCIISDNLPKEIDLDLGLITRVSLEAPIELWVKKVAQLAGFKVKDRDLIRSKFYEKSYTVEQEVDFLLDIYMRE
jgi:glycosyltransferase EpsF